MKRALATACLVALAGCGRKPAPQGGFPGPTTTQPAGASALTLPPSSAAAPAPAADQPLEGVVNDFMTGQLRIFIQQKGRLPNDFAEFARARMDSVPRTPEGTTWAIDRTTRQIKLVKVK